MATQEDKKNEGSATPVSVSYEKSPTLEGILAKLDQGFPDNQPIPETIARVKAHYRALIKNNTKPE
ncbi:MAG: hypothetical protein CMO31_04960 [Trueperaceae bacterium]|jgi:hypothetical protein|nr:hypothetical protein [Trueperaceae bacterium]|tara:strand:- start:347 stop:544 length:198 start_codon:yes stop_codon:yes gene_type:complete